jgi:FRG domain
MRMPSDVSFNIQPCRGDIGSVQEFVSDVFNLRSSIRDRKLLYRGHGKSSYELKPTIGRPLQYLGESVSLADRQTEISLLHRFRRRAYPHAQRTITAGEAIFIARHHELPTRLLDWTANALFALYFACFKHHDEDGTVWAMLRRAEERHDIDPFKLSQIQTEKELFDYRKSGDPSHPAIKIVHPIYNTPRLLAQDGAFTFHSDPQKSIKGYVCSRFREENLDIEMLYCWHVPNKHKVNIIRGLSGLGITHRSVYPDLDGIAKSLWETEALWRA